MVSKNARKTRKVQGKPKSTQAQPQQAPRLYRSRKEKIIAGVCGGIAEYFNIDPVWVRLLALIFVLLGGVTIFIYLIFWIAIPKNPKQPESKNTVAEDAFDDKDENRRSAKIIGMLLISLGLILLIKNVFGWFQFRYLWPVILVVFGLYLLLKKR